MKRKLIMVAVLVLLLGYWVWRSREVEVIKRQCKTFISMADSVDGGVGLFNVNRLESLLAESIRFHIEAVEREPFQVGKIEVISGYQWLAKKAQKADFKIAEFKAITIAGKRAEVRTVVEGILEMPDMRMFDGSQECNFTWIKDQNGKWELSEFVFLD